MRPGYDYLLMCKDILKVLDRSIRNALPHETEQGWLHPLYASGPSIRPLDLLRRILSREESKILHWRCSLSSWDSLSKGDCRVAIWQYLTRQWRCSLVVSESRQRGWLSYCHLISFVQRLNPPMTFSVCFKASVLSIHPAQKEVVHRWWTTSLPATDVADNSLYYASDTRCQRTDSLKRPLCKDESQWHW